MWIGISLLVVIVDQATKLAIIQWVGLYERIAVTPFINITHQENPGAAFSFLADADGWQRWFFTLIAIAVSAIFTVWLWRLRETRQVVLPVGIALVIGGAIGNVLDRVRLGHVVDFIQVLIAGWPFPSFNIADSAITVGAALLIIDALFLSGKQQSQPAGN
jgi:signal peptidase II